MAPNKFSPYLSVSFRRGVESRDPIVSPSHACPILPIAQAMLPAWSLTLITLKVPRLRTAALLRETGL